MNFGNAAMNYGIAYDNAIIEPDTYVKLNIAFGSALSSNNSSYESEFYSLTVNEETNVAALDFARLDEAEIARLIPLFEGAVKPAYKFCISMNSWMVYDKKENTLVSVLKPVPKVTVARQYHANERYGSGPSAMYGRDIMALAQNGNGNDRASLFDLLQ